MSSLQATPPMDEQQGKFDLWTLFYGSYPPTPKKKILNYAIFLPQHYWLNRGHSLRMLNQMMFHSPWMKDLPSTVWLQWTQNGMSEY